jgi:serine/threonine protein kinase
LTDAQAPELLAGTGFNEKVDVYAFGVCLWEMLARLLPFAETPPGQLKEKIIAGGRPEIPLSCPKAMANLIKVGLTCSPSTHPP